MGNFNRDNNKQSFSSNRFDRSRNSGGRSFERPEMHHATCSNCGKDCEVPFKPTGSKPVFCSECFEKQGGNEARRSGGENNFRRSNNFERRPSFEDRPMFQAVCAKCGNTCDLPFRPTSGRPVFCKNCFEENAASGRPERENSAPQSSQNYQRQFDDLSSKLDKILLMLSSSTPVVPAEDILEQIVVKEVAGETPAEPVKKVRKSSKKK